MERDEWEDQILKQMVEMFKQMGLDVTEDDLTRMMGQIQSQFESMGIDPEKVNPMGNAIALGHPLGATGAILTLTCAYALRRNNERYGLVSMCIGGGQGIALVIESMA